MRTRTVLALVSIAAAALAAQGIALRRTPKESDELKYQTIGALDVSGMHAEITSTDVQKVIRVDPDGSFLVESKPVEGKVKFNGSELPVKGMTTQTLYGPAGEVKEIRGDKADSSGYRMANLTSFHAPSKLVAVGDGWSSEGKSDAKTGAVAWKAEYKVTGEETIGPYAALKIDVNAHETDGTEGGKAIGTVWVGKDGIMVRNELKWTNMTVPGAPGLVSGTLTMTRMP